MRFHFIVLLILLLSIELFSQPKLDSLVALGNEQSFQFEFAEANKTFEKVISEFPNSSLGYYFICRNHLWFYIANKDSINKIKYSSFAEKTMLKAENELNENSDNAVNNYNLGNVYLLKSIFASTEQNSMDAFWATKKAVSYFEEAINLDTSFYDPYLSLGTVKYALGFVPGFLGWAISVAGLDGEKSEGLKLVLKAYENSKFSKVEASYHLGKIYTEFNAEYDSAEFYLSKLVKDYPNNELFLYQYAILQMDKRNLVKAEEYLDRIIKDESGPAFFQTFALSLFLKGEISFIRNNFSQAIKDFEKFIKNSNSIDYTGIAYYKIAVSHLMLGDNLNAKKNFLLARNGNQNISEDSHANEMSKILFDKEINDIDRLIVLAQNNLLNGKYDEIAKQLAKVNLDKATKEQVLKLDLILVEIYQIQENNLKSKLILDKYLDLDEYIEIDGFAKMLYLKSKQAFFEKKYQLAMENIELAFENLDEHDNKLNRLLINLSSKISLNTNK